MPASRLLSQYAPLTVVLIFLLMMTGCSSSADKSSSDNGEQSTESSTETPTQNESVTKTGAVTVGPDGRKSIDGIPYDVFYDDPLAVVAQTGNVTPSPVTPQPGETAESPSEEPDPEPAPAETPEKSSVDWADVIPMEIMDAEIKSIRNFLTPTLRTVGSYNREYSQIPMQGMTMAALASVALRHPGDALWKDNAAALRDLSYNLANAAEGPGRKSFEDASLQFENILQIFNGSAPAMEEEPDPEAAIADKADRGPYMKRIKAAQDWLSSNTPSAEVLADVKEKAMHETVILGTLIKISGDESYLFSDEPDYQQHVSDVMKSIEQMRDAIETENYDKFREGIGLINKKCNECHLDYQ